MIEFILFLGGMFTAWTLLGLVCAERYRRLKEMEDRIEAERAAEAAAKCAEAADVVRRKMWFPANAASSPKPNDVPVEPLVVQPETPPNETGRAAA